MGRAADASRILARPLKGGLIPAALLAVCLSPAFAIAPIIPTGGLKGVVADISGNPRMGAVVLLFNRQDKLLQRAITNEQGGFFFADLLPEAYSVRVTLAAFLPAVKNNIQVQAGRLRLLDVNLSTLFSSIELLPITNGDARSLMSDDWKWVLRTSSATRPVLRILPGMRPQQNVDPLVATHGAVFSETRGLVKVSGGDASDGNLDAGDLGTAFALATSLFGANHLKFSGNLGYAAESGTQSAGFRTSYSRNLGILGNPEISVTMRQLAMPGRGVNAMGSGIGGPIDASLPPLRMISVSFGDKAHLSDSLDIVYGVELDTVSFVQHLHYLSPYARVTWSGLGGNIDLSYTSGNARSGLDADEHGVDPDLSHDLEVLSSIPRVSLLDYHARIQRGNDYEIAYSTRRGSRDYRVSGFHTQVLNTALRVSNAGGWFSGDLLPDLYSDSSVFNAGTFNSLGYTASVTQNLGEHYKVTAIYGAGTTLVAQGATLQSDTSEDLRKLLSPARRGSVTLRASAVIPVTGTRISGSYQWTDYQAINPAEVYSTQPVRPAPGLNVSIRQPIPATLGLPWRMEATADLRNLRAQGYLPITAADGRQLIVVQNPRCFRGGLSFIF